MFRKIRFVLEKSAHSKEGLDEKNPDQPKVEKTKPKSKFLGLFHSSSDPELDSKVKTRKSFLRRKKNHSKENKDESDHIETVPDNLLADNLPPDNQFPAGPLPDKILPVNKIPDNMNAENNLEENSLSENASSQKRSVLDVVPPMDMLKSMSVSTIDSTSGFHPVAVDPLPPNDEAWERAKEVWEKNETEETKEREKEKRKKMKGRKEHHDKPREGKDAPEGKARTRSKSREKDREHSGKERSDSKNRSKEKKRREKHEETEQKHEEKRSKDEKHKKHKSKSERHGHKRESGEELQRYDVDSEHDHRHDSKTDRKHKHKHDHKHKHKHEHEHKNDQEHSDYANERKHHERHKHRDDKHAKNHEDEHHKHSKHKEPKSDLKNKKEHSKKHSPYSEEKRIELDKVWREYESGKRYHSQEKDMKKVIDRLDGVERFRREERQRWSDRSHDKSSDTSREVPHRSRSRERRRTRSRSREKQRHESDQDSNHSSTWQFSLSRIEARQEQCTADIDTARRSIEHRIKQLEMRFEKQYSSSERIPDKPAEKPDTAREPREYKKIIDQVADECREVTRTLEVRTEEMKSEIASVVREQFTNLDEKLNKQDTRPSSPGSFFGVRVVGNFRCEETMTKSPIKGDQDDDKTKLAASVTSVERPLSSADDSMITVIEENSRGTRSTPNESTGNESLSSPRDSPIRVSQSGALDTLNEPIEHKNRNSSVCDSGISADLPSSPLKSPGVENLHELSLESLEDEPSNELGGVGEGHDCNDTAEPVQIMYRRKIKETEERCQERALEEKEILYRRIDELEAMLLAAKGVKGQHV